MDGKEVIRIVILAIGSTDLDLAISVGEKLEKKCYGSIEAFVPVWKEHVSLTGFDVEKGLYNAVQVANQIYEKYRVLVKDYNVVVVGLFEAKGFLENNNPTVLYTDESRRTILVFTGDLEEKDDCLLEEKVLRLVLDGLSRMNMELSCMVPDNIGENLF
ncbi:MAG: hypothetical protein GSR81_01905 [Desulfurococcales archaeon]|nr:hypothetical protein [Desulfurococcales archaeon]